MVILTRLEGEQCHRLIAHDGEKERLVDFLEECFLRILIPIQNPTTTYSTLLWGQ